MFQKQTGGRIQMVDAGRGWAIGLMVAYHFCYDLTVFGWACWDMNHSAFWLCCRAVILSSFLLIAGASLSLSASKGGNRGRWLRSLCVLAAAAAAVSAASWVWFRESCIFFGVLHCILLCRVISLPTVRRPWMALTLGVLVLVAGHTVHSAFFDAGWRRAVGLMTAKPITEDYVPFFPWGGVFLVGVWTGTELLTRRPGAPWVPWRPRGRAGRLLCLAGRHSLAIYLLHQPLLFALFSLIRRWA